MTAEAEQEPGAVPSDRRRWSRRRRLAAALLLLVIVAMLALWTQRRPIARGFIERELQRRGVAARYEVAEIGPSTQRLENLVIGDPRKPDLVADRVIVRTRLRFGLPEVTAIEAGRVRLRGQWVNGRLSLGAIGRLMPPPSGKPFVLPEIRVSLTDARARIDSPGGVIGVKLSGAGRLHDGFRGRIAMVSDRIALSGCGAIGPQTALSIRTVKRSIEVSGPMRAAIAGCPGSGVVRGLGAVVRVTLPEALDRWRGEAQLTAAAGRASDVAMNGLDGKVTFAGSPVATEGAIDLRAARIGSAAWGSGDALLAGKYRVAGSSVRFAGRVGTKRLTLAPGVLRAFDLRMAAGTPGAALATRASDAVRQAVKGLSGTADIALRQEGGRGAIVTRAMGLESVSGARLAFDGERGIGYRWPDGGVMVDGALRLNGGGLPEAQVSLRQARPGAAVEGRALIAPYAAGGESLALAPVTFSRAADGATRIVTRAKASMTLPGGRIDGLALPIDLRWDGARRLALAGGCVPLGFDRLLLSALELRAGRLRLCPVGDTLFAQGLAGLNVGARIAAPRMNGTLGGSPVALAATQAQLRFGRRLEFALADVEARLGTPERLSRLTIGSLTGETVAGGIGGVFAGAAGSIGNVPLDLTQGAGDWRFAGGRLTLKGRSLRVADAATEPRFEPLAADDVALELAGNRIDVTGTLTVPTGGAKVADVTIGHDLGQGAGDALLAVDRLNFGEFLQPDQLTKLAFGVIADVKGGVSGAGRIRWTPEGVTSDGVFRTDGIDLAAAFGPVTGIKGELRFTDLLGLRTAPATAAIAVANPGIPVENGTVRYQLIGEQRVAVEGGRWPFANGALVLEPTVLDLSEGKERRMTFRVEGVDAASFLQQFDFKNLNATGTFDGTLPMIFDERGGRIENGRLAMRKGGGTLAYVGEVSRENLGTWGNLAFSALKSLHYDNLALTMNGPLDGEMVTEISFSGVRQGEGAKSNFLIRRLARLPLVFNVTVRAPFRQLLDSVQSYYDPTRLIQRNLPALMEEQRKRQGVQPPASEKMR